MPVFRGPLHGSTIAGLSLWETPMNSPETLQFLLLECLKTIERYDPAVVALVMEYGDAYLPWTSQPQKFLERECFVNSLCLAKSYPDDLVYCEGFALPAVNIEPEHHAWCLNSDGDAVEFTWAEPAIAYRGVAFQPTFIATWPDDEEHRGILRPQNQIKLPDETAKWLLRRLAK